MAAFPPKSLERGNVVGRAEKLPSAAAFTFRSRAGGEKALCVTHILPRMCSGGYIKHVAEWVSITREARSRFRAKNRLSYLATEKGTLKGRGDPLLRSINNRRAYAHINPLNAKCQGFDNVRLGCAILLMKRSLYVRPRERIEVEQRSEIPKSFQPLPTLSRNAILLIFCK